jgi:hypothetical protein
MRIAGDNMGCSVCRVVGQTGLADEVATRRKARSAKLIGRSIGSLHPLQSANHSSHASCIMLTWTSLETET